MCSKVHTQCGSMAIFSLHWQNDDKNIHILERKKKEGERKIEQPLDGGWLARQTNSTMTTAKIAHKKHCDKRVFLCYQIQHGVFFATQIPPTNDQIVYY